MKVLLIIVALCLAGWSIKYEDRIGDFNEKRWKEATSLESPENIAKDLRGNKFKSDITLYGPPYPRISVMIWSKRGVSIKIIPFISVREPNGKVTKFSGGEDTLKIEHVAFVHLDGRQARALIALMKKHRKLKISVLGYGAGGNYVFDLDCRGFAKAWRKTGWR